MFQPLVLRIITILLCHLTPFGLSQNTIGSAQDASTALKVGPYHIEQCQQYDKVIGKALMTMSDNIRLAIRYIDAMNTSGADTEIYDTFFYGVDPTKVKGVLTSVLRGGPTYHTRRPQQPVIFVCVLYGNPAMTRETEECKQDPIPAWHTPDTQFIYLCQTILAQHLEPRYEDCADYNRRRKRLSGGKIQIAQTMLLLHELMHLMLGKESFEKEVYGVGEVGRLPPMRKGGNAANYAYFVGNIVAGCDEFPPKVASYAEEGGL